MSTIPGLVRPAPVANEVSKPFWDACNERRLVLQIYTGCEMLVSLALFFGDGFLSRHSVEKEAEIEAMFGKIED